MVKATNLKLIGTSIIMLLLTLSCEHEENEPQISSYNSSESHKSGQNCMSCHKSGGSGEGWFTVAGTVYDKQKTAIYLNATVKLFTKTNNTLSEVATIEVDKKGNFYSTDLLNFSNGLYTSVEGSTDTIFMISPIRSGQCNSCHGVSTDKIWIE